MVWLHLKLSIWPLRPDFWFRNAPLMRNADIVEEDELTDWNFYPDSWLEMTSLDSLQLKECIRLGPRGGRSLDIWTHLDLEDQNLRTESLASWSVSSSWWMAGILMPIQKRQAPQKGFQRSDLKLLWDFSTFFWTTQDLWRHIRIHQYVVSVYLRRKCAFVYTIHNKWNIRGCALTHIIVARSFLHALAKQFW